MMGQHEHQHNETILQALQLLPGGYKPELPDLPSGRGVALGRVPVAAGEYPIGSDSHEPYDNEHPRYHVRLKAFDIERFPVTCGQVLGFTKERRYSLQDPRTAA